jgi:hypothetical protein
MAFGKMGWNSGTHENGDVDEAMRWKMPLIVVSMGSLVPPTGHLLQASSASHKGGLSVSSHQLSPQSTQTIGLSISCLPTVRISLGKPFGYCIY